MGRRYTVPFCAAFGKVGDHSDCFRETIDYLKGIFGKTPADLAKNWQLHVNPSHRCAELAHDDDGETFANLFQRHRHICPVTIPAPRVFFAGQSYREFSPPPLARIGG